MSILGRTSVPHNWREGDSAMPSNTDRTISRTDCNTPKFSKKCNRRQSEILSESCMDSSRMRSSTTCEVFKSDQPTPSLSKCQSAHQNLVSGGLASVCSRYSDMACCEKTCEQSQPTNFKFTDSVKSRQFNEYSVKSIRKLLNLRPTPLKRFSGDACLRNDAHEPVFCQCHPVGCHLAQNLTGGGNQTCMQYRDCVNPCFVKQSTKSKYNPYINPTFPIPVMSKTHMYAPPELDVCMNCRVVPSTIRKACLCGMCETPILCNSSRDFASSFDTPDRNQSTVGFTSTCKLCGALDDCCWANSISSPAPNKQVYPPRWCCTTPDRQFLSQDACSDVPVQSCDVSGRCNYSSDAASDILVRRHYIGEQPSPSPDSCPSIKVRRFQSPKPRYKSPKRKKKATFSSSCDYRAHRPTSHSPNNKSSYSQERSDACDSSDYTYVPKYKKRNKTFPLVRDQACDTLDRSSASSFMLKTNTSSLNHEGLPLCYGQSLQESWIPADEEDDIFLSYNQFPGKCFSDYTDLYENSKTESKQHYQPTTNPRCYNSNRQCCINSLKELNTRYPSSNSFSSLENTFNGRYSMQSVHTPKPHASVQFRGSPASCCKASMAFDGTQIPCCSDSLICCPNQRPQIHPTKDQYGSTLPINKCCQFSSSNKKHHPELFDWQYDHSPHYTYNLPT